MDSLAKKQLYNLAFKLLDQIDNLLDKAYQAHCIYQAELKPQSNP